jgi:hypothetical protein
LNAQRILHYSLQPLLLSFRHASKITNHFQNRKSKSLR